MKKVLLVFLAILVFIMITYAWFSSAVSNRFEQTLAEMEAKGDSFQLQDLAIVIPENESNVALIYGQAFQLLPEDIDDITEQIKPLLKELPAEIPLDLKEKLEKNTKLYQLLEQVSFDSFCAYPLQWEKGMQMEIPHLTAINQISVLTTLQIYIWAEEKKYPEAMSLLRASVALTNSIHKERMIISAMWENSQYKRLMDMLFPLTQRHPQLISEIKEIMKPALQQEWKARLDSAVAAERVFGINIFLDVLKKNQLDDFYDMGGFYRLPSSIVRPFVKLDALAYFRLMGELSENSSLNWQENSKKLKAIEQQVENLPWYANVTKICLPSFHSFIIQGMKFDAKRETFLLALKAQELQQKGDDIPENIASIAQIEGVSSKDPFEDEDYLWIKEEREWKIYCKGPNGKDDYLSDDDEGWSWSVQQKEN